MLSRCFKNRFRFFALSCAVSMGFSFAVAADLPPGTAYVELQPAFTLNYGQTTKVRYLQAAVTLRVRDELAAVVVAVHLDAIRHEIIMLFARQSEETVRSSVGREDILEQALEAVQALMIKETGEILVDRVLFTSWVVQS
ncbi:MULTISPECIES: flagellar basal body-associated FliL family protein [Reinekea]|uniref:Flagellar protein FliL n=1 Tax=Reinekea forsetii TaxID=1336806 RepID=A0A2K8KPB4_9GAMM|nr:MULTISPECIES: flagellar basal body-associated FliL family protein [Reinekea]ATX75214.1 flagellar biosynthesis protein FliL [Reinekea forsetii]